MNRSFMSKAPCKPPKPAPPFETQVHANSVVAGDKVLAAFG